MRLLPGSNQYVTRFAMRQENVRVRAILCLLTMTIVFTYLTGIYVSHVISNIDNKLQETFRFEAYAPTRILSPLAQSAYAETKPTPTPTPTHEEIVLAAKHGDILYRIWTNETTRGTNKTQDPTALHTYCAKKGMTNEFGYDPQQKLCFKTFQDAVNTVNKWWDKCLKNNTLAECLNLYSGSTKTYIAKFLNQ